MLEMCVFEYVVHHKVLPTRSFRVSSNTILARNFEYCKMPIDFKLFKE